MKRLGLLLLVILGCSCQRNTPLSNKVVISRDIIGDWKFDHIRIGIDTSLTSEFPDIRFESDLSFYRNGRFKNNAGYFITLGMPETLIGHMSDYKLKGDSLLVYEPVIKHWYVTRVTIHNQDSMTICGGSGRAETDAYYTFRRKKNIRDK